MRSFFLFCILSLFLQVQNKNTFSFREEYIEFRLKGSVFTVNGNYIFVNNTANTVSSEINYPFPVALSIIDSIHVFDNSQGKFLNFKRISKAILFRLVLMPLDTVKMNIFYRQTGVKDTIRYILTTTKIWGKALKRGEYTFETDTGTHIKSFSYPPDKQVIHGNHQKFYWHKKDFMPEKDFIVVMGK
ncbi:MAG: hypothetical protein ABSD71_02205 [Bacteroidales bacterium]|jgi:hypothetical protein